MKTQMIIFLLALALVLALFVPAAAQEGATPPCESETVSGTVVAVDEETRTVTVEMEGGDRCAVTLDGEYDHPIVALLGSYFGDVDAETLAAALEAIQGCAVYDADSDVWTWADCDAEGAVPVTLTLVNEDGTFTATLDGDEITLTVDDPDTPDELSQALETLVVNWNLGEEGAIVQPGDNIAAYHEEGMGFGVLVKLYQMAAESQEACLDAEEACGVTVEELIEAFQSGQGLGQLFKECGKPSMLGVGHVRKALAAEAAASEEAGGDTGKPDKVKADKTTGICNARSKGGNAKAKGHETVDCP
jgi:hypothetical protein